MNLTDLDILNYEKQGVDKDMALKIEKKVYEDYPVTKKEKECRSEKIKRIELRNERRKRYIEQHKRVY